MHPSVISCGTSAKHGHLARTESYSGLCQAVAGRSGRSDPNEDTFLECSQSAHAQVLAPARQMSVVCSAQDL